MKLPSGRIYLDFNATTPLAGPVAQALESAQRELFGNASSLYREGRDSMAALFTARERVAALVGCEPGEVIFTGSATEADHLAVASALHGADPGRTRVLLSAIEHPAVFDQRDSMERKGFQVEEIPVTAQGVLDLARFEAQMGEDVALVSVMAAHNESGVLQPLEDVGRLCRHYGALFHTDAVQALGKVSSPWRTARPHYVAVAAHKLYGPKGIGALAARNGAPLVPLLVGGGQEGGRRSSTEAVPLAVAFGAACELAVKALDQGGRLAQLRDDMERRLRKDHGAVVHGGEAPRLPNTSFFSLPGFSGPALVLALDEAGVAISTGSACHSGGTAGPRVLKAMDVDQGLMGSVLRVSLGRESERQDTETLLSLLPAVLKRLKGGPEA